MPPRDVVRIEAMVNFFTYNYPRPSGNNPFGASIEAAPAPWNPQHRLVRIGIKAKEADGRRQPSGKTVATDMKLEIEFNAAMVAEYRLIDDANPALRTQLSNNDAKDAGTVEAGQTFTALYEIVPKTLKNGSNQTLTVKVSYKDPNGVDSRQLVFPFVDRGQTFDRTSIDYRFAAAVASFGMVLRNSQFKGTASIESTLAIAEHSLGPDRNGQRHEFVQLVERARQLTAKRQ
jgi:Ca-activated chloride channel family protein